MVRTRRLWAALVPAVLAAAGLGGCQSTPKNIQQAVIAYYAGDYPRSEAILSPTTQKKDNDFVLNNCRFGSAAIAAGNLQAAETAFLAAYEVINGVKTNSGGRTLGAVLVFEGVRVWKGEPFERAMAHYYLGLCYLIRNDYDNARAAFSNSVFSLRGYDDEKKNGGRPVESDFALGYLGLGLCYHRMGNAEGAQKNFDMAVKLAPGLGPTITEMTKPETNTLIFVDYGMGPRRAARGWYNEESAFGPTPAEAGGVPRTRLFADGKMVADERLWTATVDTLAMAQQQKWQDIDTIKKTKAVIGTGAMAVGAGTAGYGLYRNDPGIALAGLGVAALGAAVAASSQSDVRYWEMLPRTVYLIPASLAPGEHMIQVQAGAATSVPFKVTVKDKGQGDTVLYVRLR